MIHCPSFAIFGSEHEAHPGGVGECGARWVKMKGAFRTPGIPTHEHLSPRMVLSIEGVEYRQA